MSPSSDLKQRRVQFEELALPLTNVLYGTALRLTRNAAKAEDLVQETFVRAWQNFDRFELGTNFKAWTFRILTFLYKNDRRSAKNRELTVDYTEGEEVRAPAEKDEPGAPEAGSGVDWDAAYPDLVDDEFKRALDRLDDDQRAVLLLVTLGELSYQETADALEVPIGTVMSRLFRARKQLQRDLEDYAKERGLMRNAAAGQEAK